MRDWIQFMKAKLNKQWINIKCYQGLKLNLKVMCIHYIQIWHAVCADKISLKMRSCLCLIVSTYIMRLVSQDIGDMVGGDVRIVDKLFQWLRMNGLHEIEMKMNWNVYENNQWCFLRKSIAITKNNILLEINGSL